ncbi:hypothetical protein PIB30_109976, partial [Stylosanthes scabra]|nr:hypothetical protein [Stylosanthes scabra]
DMEEIPALFYKNFKEELSNNVMFTNEASIEVKLLLERGQRTTVIVGGLLNLSKLYGLKSGGWLKMLNIGNNVFFTVKIMHENMMCKEICSISFRRCLDVKPNVVIDGQVDLCDDFIEDGLDANSMLNVSYQDQHILMNDYHMNEVCSPGPKSYNECCSNLLCDELPTDSSLYSPKEYFGEPSFQPPPPSEGVMASMAPIFGHEFSLSKHICEAILNNQILREIFTLDAATILRGSNISNDNWER